MELRWYQVLIAILLPIIGSIASIDWGWFQ